MSDICTLKMGSSTFLNSKKMKLLSLEYILSADC